MESDYTGVPVRQLRSLIEKYLGGKSKRWLSEKTGIDPRELDRIMDRASDTAVIGLHKSDLILMALGQNISELELRGELQVVPLGASMINARLMAADILWSQDHPALPAELASLARILLKVKHAAVREEIAA